MINEKLERHKLFSGLSKDQLLEIEKIMEVCTYKSDECICREGESAKQAYIIVDGKVKVSKQKETNEQAYDIANLSSGAILGEISLINRIPHSATVRTLSPVTMLILPFDKFDALKDDTDHIKQLIYYKIIENIASELCRRITYTNQLLIDMLHSKKTEEDIRNAKMTIFAGFWTM